ncbi:hypothetical protein B0H13DRAFT_2308032 [Mycena leptocephala]|nr:hypothetical protein B0H13DRAFT_2308032 [Mycena leptocephala]
MLPLEPPPLRLRETGHKEALALREVHSAPQMSPADNTELPEGPDNALPDLSMADPPVPLPPSARQISWLFGKWFWNDGADKSKSSRKNLLDIILSEVFDKEDLRGVNFDKIDNVLGTANTSEMECEGNGWKTSTVTIQIPIGEKATKATKRARAAATQTAKRHNQVDPDADDIETRKTEIPGFHHRSLIHIMRSIIEFDEAAKSFHWHPYEQYWTPAVPWALSEERVHDELYCSQALIEADHKLQASPPEPGCKLPRAIARFMFWSDANEI